MNVIKIGVIEDELIIAENIIHTLSEIGYQTVEAAVSYSEAVVMIQEEKPDLVLLDIHLSGKRDGVDVANYINQHQKIPFIFLTANSDIPTLERAKKVNPAAYLLKPFTKEDLFVCIEVALSNYRISQKVATPSNTSSAPQFRNAIFVKDKQAFVRVHLDEILFVESNGNYIYLYLTNGSKLLQRSTLAIVL